MAQGTSLHVGLNNVSPTAYQGATPLSGCINDANDMRQIALAQGSQTHALTDESATADAVIDMLSVWAQRMRTGDLMLVTYSGHGGSIIDHNGDKEDSRDETWCLYDRMLLDDELAAIWAQFARGVRIFVLSDSCHSGTVLRQIRLPAPGSRSLFLPPPRLLRANGAARLGKPGARAIVLPGPAAPDLAAVAPIPPRALRNMVEAASNSIRVRAAARHIRPRAMPPQATLSALEADPQIYTTVRALSRATRNHPVEASVILISGCRDDQLSGDGDQNGLFTEKLREVWADGAFTGSHEDFHSAILARMPDDQSPGLTRIGPDDPEFLNQRPFTITTNAANEPVSSALWVRGPDQVPQDGPPPEFQVNAWPNSYFIFEIASDPALFDTAGAGPQRNGTNFYGSWLDSPHHSGASY